VKKQITFIDLPSFAPEQELLAHWIKKCAIAYNGTIRIVQYNFVSEADMFKLNSSFLSHDTHTDIITFSYSETTEIEAEVFICTERLVENAKINRETTDNELLRLISHAILHCLGYGDKTIAEKKIMRTEEDNCISMFHVKPLQDV
jgi:rRNA maturation RNase YbeY